MVLGTIVRICVAFGSLPANNRISNPAECSMLWQSCYVWRHRLNYFKNVSGLNSDLNRRTCKPVLSWKWPHVSGEWRTGNSAVVIPGSRWRQRTHAVIQQMRGFMFLRNRVPVLLTQCHFSKVGPKQKQALLVALGSEPKKREST